LALSQAKTNLAKRNQGKKGDDAKAGAEGEGAEVDTSDAVFDVLGYLPRTIFEEQ